MKRLIILSILISNAVYSYSQLEKRDLPKYTLISEVKDFGRLIARLEYKLIEKDTVYSIFFDNNKYTHITEIQSVSFSGQDGTLAALFLILNEAIQADKGKENAFKLGDTEVLVITRKILGVKSIDFFLVKNGAYFSLTKRQLDKLTAKKE